MSVRLSREGSVGPNGSMRGLKRRIGGWLVAAAMVGALLWNPGTAQAASPSTYLSFAVPLASSMTSRYGVPTSVALAQSILETGWGGSELAVNAKNYFGIKCKTVVSPLQVGCYSKDSKEFFDNTWTSAVSLFRVYNSPGDSFLDYGRHLSTTSRYSSAMAVTNNPDEFIRRVAAAGYATDPGYSSLIIGLMVKYNLYQYDPGPPAPVASATTAPPAPTSTAPVAKPSSKAAAPTAAAKTSSVPVRKTTATTRSTPTTSSASAQKTTPASTPPPAPAFAAWQPQPADAWRGFLTGDRRVGRWFIGRDSWPQAH